MRKEFLDHTVQWFIIALVSLFSFYMYAHIIEKVFLVDLPYVRAITLTNAPIINRHLDLNAIPTEERTKYGFYGRPLTLRVPRLGLTLNLQEAQSAENGWRVSDGAVSYLVYQPSQAGRVGDITLFGADHSFLLDSMHQMVEGERIGLETENWTYSFRVTRKIALTNNQSFLPAQHSPTLTLVKRLEADTVLVIEAEFLSVQEVQR